MTKTIRLFFFFILLAWPCAALAQSQPPITFREADGSPKLVQPTEVVVPNGSLTVSGRRVTLLFGTLSGSFTSGQVAIANGASSLTGDSDFTFATDTVTVTKAVIGGGSAITSSGPGGALGTGAFQPTGATVTLNNLGTTSINAALLPQTSIDLGAAATSFRDLYLFGGGTYGTTSIRLTGVPTGARTITIPDATDTLAIVGANNSFTTNQQVSVSDTNISSIANVLNLRHIRSSGTPAAGMGTGLTLQVATGTGSTNRTIGEIDAVLTTATDATRTGDVVIQAVNSGTLAEVGRFTGAGNLTVVGGITAATLNGNTFTTGTYTLTGTAAKTLNFTNTLTLTGTDSSSVAFGAGGTVSYTSGRIDQNNASTTSAQFFSIISDETGGSGNVVGSASPTFTGTLTAATVTASGNATLSTDDSVLQVYAGTANTGIVIARSNALSTQTLVMNNNGGSGTFTSRVGNGEGSFVFNTRLNNTTNTTRLAIAYNNVTDVGLASNSVLGFASTASATGTIDSAFTRISIGLVGVGTGAAGSFAGSLKLTDITAVGANVIFSGLGSDATHTDATVCADSTTGLLYKGSGTLGICLGTSSARFKNSIHNLNEGLNQILALRPVSYFYDRTHGDGGQRIQYGFTAEDTKSVLPVLVGLDKTGQPNSVDMLGMLPVAIKAIQELKAEVDTLKAEIQSLKQPRRVAFHLPSIIGL